MIIRTKVKRQRFAESSCDKIMTVIAVLLLFIAAIFAFMFYRKSLSSERAALADGKGVAGLIEGKRSGDATITNLRMGDIVTYFDVDYVVEGRVDYNDSGWPWTCFMLVDGDDVRWLAVEEDDKLEVSMWEEIDMDLGTEPPKTIEYDGERFKQVENGRANVTQTGKTGRRAGMSCDYFEYEGSSERYLSVERWGMETEVSIGQDVNPYSLEILPGGGTSFA